jgi:hypothetical protein
MGGGGEEECRKSATPATASTQKMTMRKGIIATRPRIVSEEAEDVDVDDLVDRFDRLFPIDEGQPRTRATISGDVYLTLRNSEAKFLETCQ